MIYAFNNGLSTNSFYLLHPANEKDQLGWKRNFFLRALKILD